MRWLLALSLFSQLCSAMIPLAEKSIDAELIDHTYMVAVKKSSSVDIIDEVGTFLTRDGSTPTKITFKTFTAFKVELTDTEIDEIRSSSSLITSHIDYIEQDTTVEGAAESLSCPDTQRRGVDRLSYGLDMLSSPSVNDGLFDHDASWGTGIDTYVVDSGVRCTHTEFEGRCRWGINIMVNTPSQDEHGHGTHVAGTIASKTWGVAKNANIIAVKVLGRRNRGSVSNIVAGLQWAAAEIERTKRPSIINQSIGGGLSRIWDNAIAEIVASGTQIIVPAGNRNENACTGSPARETSSITVGNVDWTLARSPLSNYGSCVDIWAPGRRINSLSNRDDVSFIEMSGTSMAAPHVTGLLVGYLTYKTTSTPAELKKWVTDSALVNRLTRMEEGSPNLLLHLSCHRGDTPIPTPPPTPEPSIISTSTPRGSEENCFGEYSRSFKALTGNIAYPGGSGSYKSGENTCFFISCPGVVSIQFNKLDTEQQRDYVLLYTANSNNNDRLTLRYQLSGNSTPIVSSFRGDALVRFSSSTTQRGTFTGFDLNYTCTPHFQHRRTSTEKALWTAAGLLILFVTHQAYQLTGIWKTVS